MGSFDYLNLSKIWDCWSFSDFKAMTGCRSFGILIAFYNKIIRLCSLSIAASKLLVFSVFENLILHIFLIIIRCFGMFRNVPYAWFCRRPLLLGLSEGPAESRSHVNVSCRILDVITWFKPYMVITWFRPLVCHAVMQRSTSAKF